MSWLYLIWHHSTRFWYFLSWLLSIFFSNWLVLFFWKIISIHIIMNSEDIFIGLCGTVCESCQPLESFLLPFGCYCCFACLFVFIFVFLLLLFLIRSVKCETLARRVSWGRKKTLELVVNLLASFFFSFSLLVVFFFSFSFELFISIRLKQTRQWHDR